MMMIILPLWMCDYFILFYGSEFILVRLIVTGILCKFLQYCSATAALLTLYVNMDEPCCYLVKWMVI